MFLFSIFFFFKGKVILLRYQQFFRIIGYILFDFMAYQPLLVI